MISPALIRQVIEHEGWNPRAYWDVEQWSIGYGTKAAGSEEVIDKLEGRARLVRELTEAQGYLEAFRRGDTLTGAHLNEARQDALVDMIFNVGPGRFLGFSNMIEALRVENWDRAAYEALNSRWACQVNRRARCLAEQIRTGVHQHPAEFPGGWTMPARVA